jgi:hypothetical protein
MKLISVNHLKERVRDLLSKYAIAEYISSYPLQLSWLTFEIMGLWRT